MLKVPGFEDVDLLEQEVLDGQVNLVAGRADLHVDSCRSSGGEGWSASHSWLRL